MITSIEVDQWTGFSHHLRHLNGREPRQPDFLPVLYAALLAQGCNFGFARMAQMTEIPVDRLAWCTTWYLREDTLKAATDALVNFHHRLPLSQRWGGGTLSSSDGQRIPVAGKIRNATALRRYFLSQGLTFYSWTSDQFAQYGTKVVPATIRDATYVLDAILDNTTELSLVEHTTDTAGYTEMVFALFDLLGMQFAPRLRDIGDQQLYRLSREQKARHLAPRFKGIIKQDLILRHWEDFLRLAGSLKLGWVTASLFISKLQAYPRQNILTRAYLAQRAHLYLSPLPLPGATAEAMADWITEGIRQDRDSALARIVRDNHREQTVLAAEGYEVERRCCLEDGEGGKTAWSERVLVLRSPMHAAHQTAGLEKRLATAAKKLAALTPARGRGKRQMTDEMMLVEAIDNVLQEQRVEGLLRIDWAQQIERRTHYVGRGRGSATRAQRVIEHRHYHITPITRQDGPIAALIARFGWKAFVTNAPPERLSLAEAVLCYRNAYRVERIFHRLKSRVHIAPLFVKQDDQIEGLTYLLTLGVRVLTVTEFVLRRAQEQDTLPGLHPENKRKRTGTPTAERLLHAFAGVSLTIIQSATGEEILRRMTPLSGGQESILQRLGLGTHLYR